MEARKAALPRVRPPISSSATVNRVPGFSFRARFDVGYRLLTIPAHPSGRFRMEPLSKPSHGQNSQRRLFIAWSPQ
jgi:hypothetical protein